MPDPIIDDTDGVIAIEIAGRPPVELDLFVAHDCFVEALDGWRAEKDAPPEAKVAATKDYYDRLRAACAALGLGAVTGTTAERVRQRVAARMDDLRKKAESGSPAPTP